ncbi:hypothetical protein BV898_07735 [Hypsibius exemplaris]|uniref:Uncharacterized protein n=1 Tax=Hypsibius exemplaris TaxID=2072580 RepID=A0A1W0WSJ2_HYPEX|nr:hypothetical protein BV898_07735 [Hypsibius exemplaris]
MDDSFTCRFEERKRKSEPVTHNLLNNAFQIEISAEMISNAARSIRTDTPPGPNHVIMRILKQKEVAAVLAVIGTSMLQWDHTPVRYRHGRTILVPKGPEGKDQRPVTICSVLRRVVERVLDWYIKIFISVSACHNGFNRSPGVHVASSIIGDCLQHATTTKSDIYVVLLDVSKAFEKIPHTTSYVYCNEPIYLTNCSCW